MPMTLTQFRKTNGFSLVELMVAVVIGIVVLNGVLQVVVSSRQSYSDNQEVSFIQENARYALDVLSRDLRMAGYRGCANETQNVANTIAEFAKTTNLSPFTSKLGIQGYNTTTTFPAAYKQDVSGTDSIMIRRGEYEEEYFVSKHMRTTNTLTVSETPDFVTGTPLMIAHQNCRNVAMFVATAVDSANKTVIHAMNSENCTNSLGGEFDCSCIAGSCKDTVSDKTYSAGSRLMRYVAHAYYVGDSSVVPGTPALKREVLSMDGNNVVTRAEELAIGVEDIVFTYGIDTNDDSVADKYVRANETIASGVAEGINDDWSNVLVVRVQLSLRSESRVKPDDGNGNDGFLRQTVNTTVNIRNRG